MSKRGLHLYKPLALTTLTALIGLGGAAQAQNYTAGGPVYTGATNGTIVCRVFNGGPGAVTTSVREIWTAPPAGGLGSRLTNTGDTCTAPLAVGQTCVYIAPITGDVTYSCRVVDQSTIPSLSVYPTKQ
jgi:hypothetical protein